MNLITAHPKIVTLGIGFAITFAIGTTIHSINGIDFQNVYAQPEDGHSVDQ